MVEKLSKVLEGLKNIQFTTSSDDTNVSKKEKMFYCVLAADVVVSLKAKNMQNLPVIIENMISLCDDKDSDVRMVADESLNRIIMSLPQSDMLKVQVKLHNIIKKNGEARCLRAALSRFGQLSCYLRPNKGKGHVQLLVPALIEVAKREEESIHETLASSLENIFKVLGVFVKDNALKGLLKAFLHNLSSSNPVIRRCSASCIITIVQYSRKPLIFNCFVLNSLLDCIVPVCEENSTDLILGVLGCIRLLLPTLICVKNEEGISGSFGLTRKQEESILSVDRLIQAYELCLHYTNSKDHNVVATALETLNQILQNPPHQLETFFLSPAGFSRSYIHSSKENRLWSRSGSEMSVAFSLSATEDAFLLDDTDITSELSFSNGESFKKQNSTKLFKDGQSEDELKIENLFEEKSFGKIGGSPTLDVDSDAESTATSDSNVPTKFLMRIETEEKDVEEEFECSRSSSQDELYSPSENDKSPNAIDVGSFTDAAIPLIYCARHLAASFLLGGAPNSLKSDKTVRVSIKSLALSCISAIIKLYPVIMKMNLTKTQTEPSVQEMSNVLLYSDHGDPQIRGNVSVLVGSFINSALVESKNFESHWLEGDVSKLNFKNLIKIILKSLQDKTSVCTRQALAALKLCVNNGLFSVYNSQFLPVLEFLPALAHNSYWLVKVKLIEVLSELPYVCISDLTKSMLYQEEIIDSVLFLLLGDEDARVRQAAAEGLVRIIPNLHSGRSTVFDYGRRLTEHLDSWSKVKRDFARNQNLCLPFSHAFDDGDHDKNVEDLLSVIVAKLTCSLLAPKNKHFLSGYLEALKLLSLKYPTTVYSKGWFCEKPKTEGKDCYLTSNLISVVLSSMLTSPFGLDLAAYSNATFLLGNLFAGHSMSSLKPNYQTSSSVTDEPVKLWNVFKNERVSQLAEEVLTHLLKVLNTYSRLVEEATLSSVTESSAAANAFLPLLSPIKKQEKKTEEKIEDKKAKSSSNFKQSTQYARLQQLLKNAYTNYKVSLDVSVGGKFLDLLQSSLYALSALLEVATVQEMGRCAEEILSYLRSVVTLLPNPSVVCVIQLLKSLFGMSLASNWEENKFSSFANVQDVTLFDVCFHLPTEFLSDKIRRRVNSSSLECEALSGFGRKSERRIAGKNPDKTWLGTYIKFFEPMVWLPTYIKLFEPMIVKSLQLYLITADVKLQSNVLKLLIQLVQLRVYCKLDGKEDFVDFVLKQFELIEHGQIPFVEELLPHIFKFLILLSYEKQHSKPIMSVPKIIQLCDGLMASDQPVHTHCIPALAPVVEDVFLFRSFATSAEEKELETQREVLLSMLLRLVEFPEVMDMLSLILNESRTMEEKDKWKRWSRQVIDTVLPLLNNDRLRIETSEGQNSFAKLMSSLSPNVLRPINSLLKILFIEPSDYSCQTSVKRWLAKVTVLLETVLFVKEDALLNRLEEASPNINLNSFSPTGNLTLTDPFQVKSFFQTFEPAETAARFIVKIVSVVAKKIGESCASTCHLQQKLSMFFVCTYHILKSGMFHRIKNSLQNLLVKEQESLAMISAIFLKLSHYYPLLTSQFSYFLSLLSYCDQNYWLEILSESRTLPAKLVQSSGVISLSDYLCDNLGDAETLRFLLRHSMEDLVDLSREIPVKELLVTMHARKSDWALLLEAVSSCDFQSSPPHFVEKLLRLLELTEPCHSGLLLKLVVDKFLESPRLAISLLATSVACRQVEYLLTLPKEKVLSQIDPRNFNDLLESFKKLKCVKRHSTLGGLLEKLKVQVFGLTAIAPDAVTQLENVQLGEEWYFAQVKRRCCQKGGAGPEVPLLLTKLSSERILEIMNSPDFNVNILKACLSRGETLREKHENDNKSQESYECLIKAAERFLLHEVRKESEDLEKVAGTEREFGGGGSEKLWEVADCLVIFLDGARSNRLEVETEWVEEIAKFMLVCLKRLKEDTREGKTCPRSLETGLQCCSAILRIKEATNSPWIKDNLEGCVNDFFYVISHLVPQCRLSRMWRDKDSATASRSEQLEFLLEFIMTAPVLPDYLSDSVRALVVNLCRVPQLNSDVLKVPDGGDAQDIESLKSFISRFSVIGWSSRQQFEEIWVALLSVLGFNTQGDVPLEENGFIVQASAVAVEGITTLLKNTMLESGTGKLIHHGRDSLSMKNVYDKLPVVRNAYVEDEFDERSYQYLDNLEIQQRDDRYFHGLLSVEYLWTAIKQITSQVDLYERHHEKVNAMGLDLPSCVHLLTELYNQWIYQASPDIKIVTSALKSSIVISDLFTDIAQFQWLLNFCLRVEEVLIPEDTVVLPLVILGCCKAGAIVLPGEDTCERIRKLMLRSKSLPCRISAVEGLLYLLQSYIVCYSVNRTALPPPGSTFQTDEVNFVANVVDIFLPVAVELAQEFKLKGEPATEEHDRCHWSLIFYLLQHYQSSLGDVKEEFLNFIIATLCSKNCPDSIVALLIRGTQRLLLTTMLDESFRDQLSKVSLEVISNNSLAVSRNGLQLLSVLSFLDKRVKDIRQLVTGQEDPERVMRDMEKINVLFEKLKKSYPKEAEVVGGVIAYVLMDFTASDVLTKVIQEFLSSNQPHQKILAGLLFKVFERADQNLVEDWVVFSLPSFIQGLPIAMSIWTLNFFFVSASNEPWLRSLFPLVQSRIRMAEPEDKKLLCLAGFCFYKQLKHDSQRKSFVDTFEEAAAIDGVFHDLLSALS